ncbi:MAG: cytochrome c-type biogenesis protein CcmH [Alphaproteobacteria bacterium]|nr:cytochrome c-type biogenesis protein CcmH [Alphaproteobacteria bacterium]
MIAALALAAVLPLADPAEERRAQDLEREIRCVVCENEPISQSTADIATDMRNLVRERIKAGDSDDQIRTFFADRYGDFVLLRPRMDASTIALWGAPVALLLLGAGLIVMVRRQSAGATLEPDVRDGDR